MTTVEETDSKTQSAVSSENALTEEEMARKREQINNQRDLKRQQMLDAMAKRRMNRTNKNEDSIQLKQQINDFLEMFTKEFDRIEKSISDCNDYESFKNLQLERHALEEKLANAARYLPNYSFEQKSKQLQKLKQQIKRTQIQVAPKPKFKFTIENNANNNANSEQKVDTNSNNNNEDANNDGKKENIADNENETKKDEEIDLSQLMSNENEIKINDKNLETVTMESGSINGSDVWLSNLNNCQISLADHIGALRIDHVKNCTIITGPISSSLHVEHIENSKVHAAMRQCRIHNAKNTQFYIHVNSEPIIEHSDDVKFAPYNVEYNDLRKHWEQCQVDKKINKWDKVKDFGWFRQTQSPHWSIIPQSDRIDTVYPIENEEEDEL